VDSESEEEAGRALEAKVAEEEQRQEDGAPANKNRWGGGVLEAQWAQRGESE
jgi:hypothetical protein